MAPTSTLAVWVMRASAFADVMKLSFQEASGFQVVAY